MAKPTSKKSRATIREEFPSSDNYLSGHTSALPRLVELMLSTGQGTSAEEIILIAELWAGEEILFDPKTKTEVAVWFDKAQLTLQTTGCEIKAGSRHGERLAPAAPIIKETEQTSAASGHNVRIASDTSASFPNPASLTGTATGSGEYFHARRSNLTRITQREKLGTQHVVARGTGWEIVTVSEASDANRRQPYKYISSEDRLCDLVVRARSTARVEGRVHVIPSNLQYRISTTGSLRKIKDQLTTNQDKIIRLLLKSGIAPADERGLLLATAWLRSKAKRKSSARKVRDITPR